MNSSTRSTRSKASSRKAPTIAVTRATDGKRKHNPDSSDKEGKLHKKRYSLPANGGKGISTELSKLSVGSPYFESNNNLPNTRSRSLNNTPNLPIPGGTEKRKSLRKQAIRNEDSRRSSSETNDISPLAINVRTPELAIKKMSRLTPANYRTPVPTGHSPLPLLPWADSQDVWESMLHKDLVYIRDPFYIRKHPKLKPKMRSVLLDWLIEVSEVYRLHRETFYLAVDYVDRYLSQESGIAKQRLQLVGVTALFVASKIEEIYPPKLSEFAYVTDGACTSDEILEQEVLLMETLSWKLSPVTPITWVTVYLQIYNGKSKGRRKTKDDDDGFEFPLFNGLHLCHVAELIDLCCLNINYLQFSASIIAASALYHIIGKNILEATGHVMEDIALCVQWLEPFARVLQMQPKKQSVKKFDKIPNEDAHNIQVHNSGIQLLEYTHAHYHTQVPSGTSTRRSPLIECKGILTPPASTEKYHL